MNEKLQPNFYIPAAILIGALFIAGAILYGKNLPGGAVLPQGTDSQGNGTNKVEIQLTEQDHILGNSNASITVVEYSDLECPFCKSFHSTMQQAMAEYGDSIRWVYRHYPLDRHPKARKEAEAAECAGELGGNDGFWAYVGKVFEITPSNNNLDFDLLPQIAQDLGLDTSAFENCLNSGKYASRVEADFQEGTRLGVQGTPGSFVNGVPVRGAVPYEVLKSVIEEELKK